MLRHLVLKFGGKFESLPFGQRRKGTKLLPGTKPASHVNKAEIRDDGAAIFQKNIFGFQVFVNNASVMQISHALANLLSNDDYFIHGELFLVQMQVCV